MWPFKSKSTDQLIQEARERQRPKSEKPKPPKPPKGQDMTLTANLTQAELIKAIEDYLYDNIEDYTDETLTLEFNSKILDDSTLEITGVQATFELED